MVQRKVVVAASIVLGLLSIAIMALVTRSMVHKQATNATGKDICVTDGSVEYHDRLTRISRSWKRFFTSKQKRNFARWVPTLSGILKAGDEGLFSSTLFTNLHRYPGESSLDVLYDAFASELRNHAITGRSSYSGSITKFIAEAKRATPTSLGRTMSVSRRFSSVGRREISSKPARRSLDLSAKERGLVRAVSVRNPVASLVSSSNGLRDQGNEKLMHDSWMKDGLNATYNEGNICITVSPSELAALSIVLGSPWGISADTGNVAFRKGAYGIVIHAAPTADGTLQVTLQQQHCSIPQQYAQVIGPSTLFARHLAVGSLPYSQDKLSVKSIMITNDTFEAVQAGASLYTHTSTAQTRQTQFLQSLPSSRDISFHILAPSTEVQFSATLIDAIAALPFSGGLTPLASSPLIDTIQFIASGGLFPARLLKRLEGLVDKVHRHSPHLSIFGPLYEPANARLMYRERSRLGKIATDTNIEDILVDKTARMSRYITLLERLMALVPDTTPEEILVAVRQATRSELDRTYTDAINTSANAKISKSTAIVDSHSLLESDARSKHRSILSTQRSIRSSIVSAHTMRDGSSPISQVLPTTSAEQNLERQIEQVLKMKLPFSVETVAFVARMVIVAWTLSVEKTVWEDGEMGFQIPDLNALKDKLVLC